MSGLDTNESVGLEKERERAKEKERGRDALAD